MDSMITYIFLVFLCLNLLLLVETNAAVSYKTKLQFKILKILCRSDMGKILILPSLLLLTPSPILAGMSWRYCNLICEYRLIKTH